MLTPMDIDRKEFRKAIRGYHVEDVETFLMEITESYEELYLENQAAKEQIALLSDAVAQYKSMEETLQNALAVARRDSEDMKKAARDEADAFMQKARLQAEEEMSRLSYQYEQMKHSVEVFRAKVVSLLHAQLDIIKEYGEGEPVSLPDVQPEPAMEGFQQTAELNLPLAEQDTVEIPAICGDESEAVSS